MADNSPKALVIGAAMVDIVCYVDRLPTSGEGVVPRSVTKTVGGCALNSAAMLQHLGVKPMLFAPVGKGLFSTMVKDTIISLELTTFEPYATEPHVPSLCMPSAHLCTSSANLTPDQQVPSVPPYDCGACICLVEPNGERTMITIPGIERHFTTSWFSALSESELASLRAVIVCGYELETPGGEDILAFLESRPTLQVFYAPGPRVCAVPPERIERLQALHAIWHLNDQEVCAYTGECNLERAGQKLAAAVGAPVIVTAGAQGSYAFVPACEQAGAAHTGSTVALGDFARGECAMDNPATTINTVYVPATPVVPINTVGAGDAHLGAVVAGWVQGMTWQDTLNRANHVAAQVCLIEGTVLPRSAFPTQNQQACNITSR